MDNLKNKLYEVLIGEMHALEFEQWLYGLPDINSRLLEDEFIYDLVCLNYKSRSIRLDLKALFNKTYGEETYLIMTIENACKTITMTRSFEDILMAIDLVRSQFDFETEHNLLWDFYLMDCDIDLYNYGYCPLDEVTHMIKDTCVLILDKMSNYKETDKSALLKMSFYAEEKKLRHKAKEALESVKPKTTKNKWRLKDLFSFGK